MNDTGPICKALVWPSRSSDLNHMALVIIVMNRRDIQQEIRCTRVKLLLVGRENTENHKWSLVSFFLIDDVNRCLNAAKSSRPATGIIRSIIPSPSSTASQRSQRKKYLKWRNTRSVENFFDYVEYLMSYRHSIEIHFI